MFDVVRETRAASIVQRERHRLAAPIIQSVKACRIPLFAYQFSLAYQGWVSLARFSGGLLFRLDFREESEVSFVEFEFCQQIWATRAGATQ